MQYFKHTRHQFTLKKTIVPKLELYQVAFWEFV